MKKISFFLVIFIFSIIKLFSQCAQTSNIYSFTYNGHSYEIVKELKNWKDAAACAIQRGGYLVCIDDANENSQLMTAITTAGVSSSYHPVTDGGGASYVWTGGTDIKTEGTWLWDGDNNGIGTNFYTGQGTAGTGGGGAVGGAYINWGTTNGSEPDNFMYIHDQDGLGLALNSWPHGSAGQWNDIDTANTLYYIIEIEATGVKENDKLKNIEIYPNPANNFIQIKGNTQDIEINIVTIDGKTVISQHHINNNSDIKIDISSIPIGVYFVNVKADKNRYSAQFVKQ